MFRIQKNEKSKTWIKGRKMKDEEMDWKKINERRENEFWLKVIKKMKTMKMA